MTATEFKTARKQRGTQDEVAFALGVWRVSIARWETGTREIGKTTELALLSLPIKDRKPRKGYIPLDERSPLVKGMKEAGKIVEAEGIHSMDTLYVQPDEYSQSFPPDDFS